MKTLPRFWLVAGLFCLGAALSACGGQLTPTPTSGPRTPLPTWTLPFGTPSATLAEVATQAAPSVSETPSPSPTPEFTSTPSPTARPGIDPTLGATTPDPSANLVTAIPEPMPQIFFDPEVRNILLLGRDTAKGSGAYRTDVIIIVSINSKTQAVTMLTIPRDLFVYIPGWTMNRINTAASHGDNIKYPGGGVALLEQTILYNFGIPIHGWARIDFGGFQNVVDIIGGVDVPVTCPMQEWRLKDESYLLTDDDASHWELYTVDPGVVHMNGSMALWYARSRKRSSDFDRSRRQHQVLRAIFRRGLQLDMLPRAPELYNQYVEIVDTDLALGDLLQFVPLAGQLDQARIKSRFIGRSEVFPWTTPGGAAVLLPDRNAVAALLEEAFQPPSENIQTRAATQVEIWNGTPHSDWPTLAAENLLWEGLAPVQGQADRQDYATTMIYDYSTSAKGSPIETIKRIFKVADANVIAAPDPNAPYPFRVVLGADYTSCVKPVYVIRPTPTPGPGGVVGDGVIHAAPIIGDNPPPTDGDISEWTYLVYTSKEPAFGATNWTGESDAAAAWNLAWDEDYLYLAAHVQDDTFAQNAGGDQLYRGDSLELWLDTDLSDNGLKTLTANSFQLGLSPGNLNSPVGGPEAYLWLPQEVKRNIPGAIVVARPVSGGYDIEILVPWHELGVVPLAGKTFGFVLALNDNDSAGAQEQQTQLLQRRDQELINPSTWGILVLDAPPAP